MRRWLLLGYLGLTAFVLVILVAPLGIVSSRAERARLVAAVERDATVLAGLAEDALDQGIPTDLQTTARDYGRRTGGRVVIVDRDGISVADTDLDPGRDYSTRPEMMAALAGEVAEGSRFSDTLGHGLMYVAVPVASGGRVHGAVRVTFPTDAVDARIRRTWTGLLLVSGVVLGAATLLSLLLARTMTRPLTHLTDGTRRMAEGDAAVRVDPEGPPELRRLAQSFNIMAAGLSDLLASQESFVADASHQLRSPLAALRLRLENLEDHLRPSGADELQAAVAETMRLSRLVDGLLALTRADAVAASPEPVDLASLVTERCEAWSALGEEEGVRIVTEVSAATLSAVEGTVEQVLDNLIANALNVAPAGSQITVTATRDGGDVVLHVLDEGPGLHGEAHRRAFDRFWRGSTGGEGFGLGLAIVQRLVRNAGGTVFLEDAPTGGLDVVIRWPAAEPATRPKPAAGRT